MSISTGPGLPLRAIANAWRVTSTIRSARSTRTVHFVTGAKICSVATSWAAPRWALAGPAAGEDHDRRQPTYASAMPVSRFVAPGRR